MSIYAELSGMEGVIAAGEYAFRGDRFNYIGNLDDEQARMASIMCRATTLSTNMQTEIVCSHTEGCPFESAFGWVVRGPQFTVCVVADTFCFVQNGEGTLNRVLKYMREHLSEHRDMI
ncbi:MAG: DUF2173 family protein [Gammaproteobacteria bacterium]